MKYKIGDMLKYTFNGSWKTNEKKGDLYCIVCGKGLVRGELIVWWVNSADSDGKSFMQSVNVNDGVYGTFKKVSQ